MNADRGANANVDQQHVSWWKPTPQLRDEFAEWWRFAPFYIAVSVASFIPEGWNEILACAATLAGAAVFYTACYACVSVVTRKPIRHSTIRWLGIWMICGALSLTLAAHIAQVPERSLLTAGIMLGSIPVQAAFTVVIGRLRLDTA